MKGALFLNGEPPTAEALKKVLSERKNGSVSAVYCTDGAYSYVKDVFLPDVVVGDFDSLNRDEVGDCVECVSFPTDKNFTDGYLAIKIMAERGFAEIDIFGGYGGRPDMAESNYLLLVLAEQCGVRARLCGVLNAYLVSGYFSLRLKKGALFSVVPFTDSVHILYMKGLKYALSDYTMSKTAWVAKDDYVMGVSNASVGESVELAVDGGTALVFVQE